MKGFRAGSFFLLALAFLAAEPRAGSDILGATFDDSFDRPDSTDLGANWLEFVDGLSISSNELRAAPTKAVFPMAVVPAFSSAAQTVAASFARPSNSSPRFALLLRYQNPQNYYLFSRTGGGSSLVQISRVVGGVETVLGTKSLPNATANTFFRMEGSASLTALTLKVDGTLMLSVADSTFAAGNVGIGLGSVSSTTGLILRADNFSASTTDVPAGPVITADPSNLKVAVGQPASFTVTATGTAPLTYQWQRDTVDIPLATAATFQLPSAALSDNGATFRAVVKNGSGTATSKSATLTVITAGVPTGVITAPAMYNAGDTVQYSGAGSSDPEDGLLPGSALTWSVDFHHDALIDPFVADHTGASGSFIIPATGETSPNVFYRIHLTVKDSTGLTSSTFSDVLPNTVDLDFATVPPGLAVMLDGVTLPTPASITSVVGMHRTIGPVSPQTVGGQSYVFASWAQGGSATQDIQTPTADTSYTATYVAGDAAFADAFDRPDSPDLGSNWLEITDGLSISSQELRAAPTKTIFPKAIVPGFSSAVQTVAASFARPANSSPRFALLLRYQSPQNYYLFSRTAGGSSLVQISRVVNGIETVLGTKSEPNPANDTFFRMEGKANGTTLTLSLDGVAQLSVQDSTFSSGNVGIGLGNVGSTVLTLRADNFAAAASDASAAPALTLTANPTSIPTNGSSMLTWNTSGASACNFTSGLSGPRSINGSETTGPLAATTTFGMTCTGPGGSTSKSVTVTVGPTLTLTAAPSAVVANGSSTLTWSAFDVAGCDFTSGLTGSRPISGSESTGPLAATTTFAMTCTGPDGSVFKSVTVPVGVLTTTLPTAEDVFATETMNLPTSVRNFVFLIPNESHHQDVTRNLSPKNGYLLPMKVTLPAGATVSVVNADFGHVHTQTIRDATSEVFATGSLVFGALSPPATLAPGAYTLIDSTWPWIRGDITIGNIPSDGNLLVGGFYFPEKRLDDYRSLFAANGFRIESEYKFTYFGKVNYLIIFSTDQDLSVAGPKLQALVKANSYG